MAAGDVAREARALKRRHRDLLSSEPSFRATAGQERAMDAIESARARLQGAERRDEAQLALELFARLS